MDIRTLEILDYLRLRDTIAGCCMSTEGTSALKERLPLTDADEIRRLKRLAGEWMGLMRSGQTASAGSWPAIGQILPPLLTEGTVLSIEELFAAGLFCRGTLELKKILSNYDFPLLAAEASKIPSLEESAAEIFRILDNSGQMRDLPEIRAVRASIVRIRRDIDSLVRRYTGDESLKSAFQSGIPTIRDGRQVLAVKANFRGRIKGVVHEVSQTGQTVYIEPEDVVNRNNDLVQEEYRLAREIQRILREATERLRRWHGDLSDAREKMIFLDTIYASARWGSEHSCIFAAEIHPDQDTEEPASPLLLIQARHPVLGRNAVPIDLRLLPGSRILIITGPNTGGKTVALKTAALFALLNQSGFPVPAGEGTALPVFDAVFADIGDEQSLDQSLSTFSGHMKNIASMLRSAGEQSLVLLDELGSGTDPQEGSAIAMSVLDSLITKKALVLVTTHHGVLKNYGYTHSVCVNASVDFDETTLSPTYRIVMGVPGESRALDIAVRNGLDEETAQRARGYLLDEQADVSALIKGLTAKHEQVARIEKEQETEESIIREKRRKADLQELKLRQKELELREQGYRRMEHFLDESRSLLENLVRELREGEITREKNLKVKDYIAGLARSAAEEKENLIRSREELEQMTQEYEKELCSTEDPSAASVSAQAAAPEVFAPGVEVFIVPAKRRAVLVREDRRGSWIAGIGDLKMTVKEKDMVPAPRAEKRVSVSVDFIAPPSSDTPVFELNLRGMRYDEAIKALESQLDLAVMGGLREFSIIHGKGNGILQQGVHGYLKKYPGIEDFTFARPEDGGTGKTLVKLK